MGGIGRMFYAFFCFWLLYMSGLFFIRLRLCVCSVRCLHHAIGSWDSIRMVLGVWCRLWRLGVRIRVVNCGGVFDFWF